MKALILGAAGMVGQKLLQTILSQEKTSSEYSEITLYDVVAAKKPKTKIPLTVLTGDISEINESIKLAAIKPDVIFHLASIVSGEAEEDFSKGWTINAKGTWQLLEQIRKIHETSAGSYLPRLIFTSSIAVFGPPFPVKIDDDFLCAPQTSYGGQKALTELLISDYSRKGFIDGISIRLPTICVRPGKPNLAASSFFSGIIREPLNGLEAILPVSNEVRHWHASPRSAAAFLSHACTLDLTKLGSRRSLNMPGVSCTIEEQIEALRKIAGSKVVAKIRYQPNSKIVKIVDGWPRNFDPVRATALGFKSESSFEEIINVYLDDDFEK